MQYRLKNEKYLNKVLKYFCGERNLIFLHKLIAEQSKYLSKLENKEIKILIDLKYNIHCYLNNDFNNHEICSYHFINKNNIDYVIWECFDNSNCNNMMRKVERLLDY